MHLDSDLVEELNLLLRLSQGASAEGNEMHLNSGAAKRLYQKGLVAQADGGHLTEQGREAAEFASRLMDLLAPPLEPI